MKHKLLPLLLSVSFFLSFSFLPTEAQALNQTPRERLIQQIEILRYEISLLGSLLSSMRAREEISASAYLAIDLSDDSVLLEKNPDQVYSIASITKLMSAVIALEKIDPEKEIALTREMLRPYGYSPSLFTGLSISSENLLKASLIQSTNDASESLAYFLGKEKFVSLMNQKAKSLEMNNTVFFDAHGLNPANKSTARDLVNLLKYIQKEHPEILKITRNNDFWLPDSSGKMLKFRNVNNLYPLPYFLGGKTGYLPQVNQTIASIFNVNGKPTALILLSSKNRETDIFSILRKIRE